jgi:hypothetical protein
VGVVGWLVVVQHKDRTGKREKKVERGREMREARESDYAGTTFVQERRNTRLEEQQQIDGEG